MLRASIAIPAEALALEYASSAVPGIEVEAERIAAHSTEWIMPCLWIADGEFDAVENALESDPSIDEVVASVRFDEAAFYHVEWAEDVIRRIDSYIDKEGSLLEARLSGGEWRVDFRFADREQFDAFREQFADRDYSFRLLSLTEMTRSDHELQDLTAAQRDALVAAAERGYYRVPRETTTAELADDLGITHQAISELLRRGTENLVFATLPAERESESS
ncbi:Bacterio-opsin activator HTH domain-containing protein [Haloterrigena salina JCM 13891]|uniref:Bacterio-opsin activator HTH domain-containing protein n=1 Tax=Haloterrigena salina JCM 13891 TaxID=1227488 RepID=M0CEP7_9EURY|nr:helix-turn-helix domain-containing protein [Haloterrigena salina]ELZ21736.1 Bacterio-opsin activator HTH domain-containing protein [Haloterrigena salina JCM 13891]